MTITYKATVKLRMFFIIVVYIPAKSIKEAREKLEALLGAMGQGNYNINIQISSKPLYMVKTGTKVVQ